MAHGRTIVDRYRPTHSRLSIQCGRYGSFPAGTAIGLATAADISPAHDAALIHSGTAEPIALPFEPSALSAHAVTVAPAVKSLVTDPLTC